MKQILLGFMLTTGLSLSAQTFTKVAVNGLTSVYISGLAYSDIDGDGDLEVVLSGQSNNASEADIYNFESGKFVKLPNTDLVGMKEGGCVFADIDGDGDEDLFMYGRTSFGKLSLMFRNEGGEFVQDDNEIEGFLSGEAEFVDVDNDNDLDLFISGSGETVRMTSLYLNENGTFTKDDQNSFVGVSGSQLGFIDIDNNGFKDVIITGTTNGFPLEPTIQFYSNTGGVFTEIPNPGFDAGVYGSLSIADVNGDGHDDIFITGQITSDVIGSTLYTNNANGTFTLEINSPFTPVYQSASHIVDIDNDGDLDIVLSGRDNLGEPTIGVYHNDGGTFTDATDANLEGLSAGSLAVADFNNDGDKDIIVTGRDSDLEKQTYFFTSDGNVTSVKNHEVQDLNITLYPNPVDNGVLHIATQTNSNAALQVNIYDVAGANVLSIENFEQNGASSSTLDVGSLTQGAYILEMLQGENVQVSKFTISE